MLSAVEAMKVFKHSIVSVWERVTGTSAWVQLKIRGCVAVLWYTQPTCELWRSLRLSQARPVVRGTNGEVGLALVQLVPLIAKPDSSLHLQ